MTGRDWTRIAIAAGVVWALILVAIVLGVAVSS